MTNILRPMIRGRIHVGICGRSSNDKIADGSMFLWWFIFSRWLAPMKSQYLQEYNGLPLTWLFIFLSFFLSGWSIFMCLYNCLWLPPRKSQCLHLNFAKSFAIVPSSTSPSSPNFSLIWVFSVSIDSIASDISMFMGVPSGSGSVEGVLEVFQLESSKQSQTEVET